MHPFLGSDQGCHGQGNYLEKKFFSMSGKSQGISWMVREIQKGLGKSGKSQGIRKNGYGRQSSENLFILFKREKDVHSH